MASIRDCSGVLERGRRVQAELPSDIKVSFEFDQSPYVTRAISSLFTEAALGALLTGLMVLIVWWLAASPWLTP